MESGRPRGAMPVFKIVALVLAVAVLFSLFFFDIWRRQNRRVEHIIRDQFNQQQLELARKIADNVEAYFDFLENALLGYAGLFQNTPPETRGLEAALAERFIRHKAFGVLEMRRYDAAGVLVQALNSTPTPSAPGALTLPAPYLKWSQDPAHRGRLFLSKTCVSSDPAWRGRRVMRFITPLYWPGPTPNFAGALELIIDPFFIGRKVTEGVRSGQTGYAWIIDQNGIMLAHYEKEFVGQDALQVRIARNPKIVFQGLEEIHARIYQGLEGTGEYSSGWHRQKLGQMPKLVAYATIRFDKGLIRGVTDVEDPTHNLWGVAVVAPVEEVYGLVQEANYQVFILLALFSLLVILASGGLITVALVWNKTLAQQVEIKTRDLVESQERLLMAERFAAVGEAAAYVSHEIKNPLMVIGGLAHQVERRLTEDEPAREKLKIIRDEVSRLENLLGDLRDFTRPAPLVRQKLDLNQMIREVQNLMTDQAHEKGLIVIDRLAPDLPPVETDPNQMRQVLVNLIKNALEATDPDGHIVLSSGTAEGQAWFSIKDTGKGIPTEMMDKIFHPFFTTKDKGTGLGLAVSHKIITDHQGTITVESAPGQGTTFIVRIPLSGQTL